MSTTDPLLLQEQDVDSLATAPVVLEAARRTADIVASRKLSTARLQIGDDRIWSRVLLGIIPGLDLLGYKEFHRVDQRVRYHVHLFSRESGDHVATVDGRRITSLRTAGTAAVAIAHHAGAGAQRVGIVGSGEEAREGLRMVCGAIDVESVRVFSPTQANREAYAVELGDELDVPIEPVGTVDDALAEATVAYIATSAAGEPFLSAGQVAEVPVTAAIGSTRPEQRELCGDVLAAAGHVVIDCDDARHEPGDVVEAVEQYGFDASAAALLGDDLGVPPRTEQRPVVFKSIGSVEQDLVLAAALVDQAVASGCGHPAPPVASLRIMR